MGRFQGQGPDLCLLIQQGWGVQQGPGVSGGGALPAQALREEGPSLSQEQTSVQSTAHYEGSQDWNGDSSVHPGL